MEKFVTEEQPVKVLSLLGAALLSMLFMLAVVTSGVGFNTQETQIPDLFSPQHVMAVVDQTAWVYSNAVHAYLINPAKSDFGFVPENVQWIAQNAELTLAVAVGLADPLPQVTAAVPPISQGEVAAASTQYNGNVFSLAFGK